MDIDLPTLKVERLYRQIFAVLQRHIEQGVFKPGEALPSERDLSKKLGVSRSSVREALIALEMRGWVEIRTGHGVFVRTNQPEAAAANSAIEEGGVADLLKAREFLEGEFCLLAARHATEAQMDALESIVASMELQETDNEEFHLADRNFHLKIAEMTGNPVLHDVMLQLWSRRYSPLYKRFEDHYNERNLAPDLAQDHRDIYVALRSRDGNRARDLMRVHMQHVYKSLFRLAQ
ncbi:MAG TPA: FadR/GntR family transcriptional regulator [Rhodocyclaceae bacterium]|nr:FadR/GntR family transcriptional regulator [Rhodocyclaceae bacterium]